MSNGWIGFYIRVPTITLLKFLFKSLLNKKTIYNKATENKIILLSVRVYRTIKPFMLLLQSDCKCKFLWSNLRLKTYSFLYYCSCYGFVSFCNNNVSKISDVVFNFFLSFYSLFFNT